MASSSLSAARRISIILRGINNRHSLLRSANYASDIYQSSSTRASSMATSHYYDINNIQTYKMSTIATTASEHDGDDLFDNLSSNNTDSHTAPLFSSIPTLHPSSLHAIEHKMKLSTMTEIQHKTFEAASLGQDILGRARTGTGKTLAFLLPALENALRLGRVPGKFDRSSHNVSNHNVGGHEKRKKGGIAILVISPTRELAMQIHTQAQVLTSSHSNTSLDNVKYAQKQSKMISQVMYGGSSKQIDVNKLKDNIPYILVATPGRLIDHMKSTHVNGVPFSEIISNVSVWVLDEADRCLDMGFRNDMEYILGHKKEKSASQQTLLFSATLPKDLRKIMASHMRKDYMTIDCVHDVDPASHTNVNVDQSYVTLPKDNNSRFITGLVDIIQDITHIQNPTHYKIVVFFPTTAQCQFFSHLFNTIFKIPVLEIHSKKSQSNRTAVSSNFRKFTKGILFTTDVSARGVDYPAVTHVVQFGSAENRETYIHRLGRTGRAGKVGRGIIVCGIESESEQFVLNELEGLDVKSDERYQTLLNGEMVVQDGDAGGGVNGYLKRKEINDSRLQKIQSGIANRDPMLFKLAGATYRSLLGYNISKMNNLGMNSKDEVVKYINSLAIQMGFKKNEMPHVSPKIVSTLGLQKLNYLLNVGNPSGSDGGSSGGRGGRGGYDRRSGGRDRANSYHGRRGGRGERRDRYGGRDSYGERYLAGELLLPEISLL